MTKARDFSLNSRAQKGISFYTIGKGIFFNEFDEPSMVGKV